MPKLVEREGIKGLAAEVRVNGQWFEAIALSCRLVSEVNAASPAVICGLVPGDIVIIFAITGAGCEYMSAAHPLRDEGARWRYFDHK